MFYKKKLFSFSKEQIPSQKGMFYKKKLFSFSKEQIPSQKG